MKDQQNLLFRIVVLLGAYISGCHGTATTTLLPQKVESAENTNVTLVCTYDGQYAGSFQQGYFIWIWNSTSRSITPNGDCTVRAGWLTNSLLYSYKCINDTSHSITLLNIKQQQDGEMYQCRPGISTLEFNFSNIVTVRITVAVKVAAISPYTNMLTIVENGTFELLCTSSPCRPMPKFRWYITNNNNPDGSVSILTEGAPIESEAGAIQSYTHRCGINTKRTWNNWFLFCGASNSDVDFILSAKILINVTYPPTMNIAKEATIIEGENLDNLCNFTPGNPPDTNITWSWKGSTWNVNPQQPYIVSRNRSGLYRCSVQNLMVSSDGIRVFGNASGEIDLSVQYKTSVLRFSINELNDIVNFTIKENHTVNLICDIEGLPLPTGQLLHQSFLNQQVTDFPSYLTSKNSTNVQLTRSFPAQCTDTGIHTCGGANLFYNGQQSESKKSLALFVMCKPRKSPFITIHDTVKSPTLVDVTLSFTTLAYPVPPEAGYVWTRQGETPDVWLNIASSGNKTNISTRGLQSNLTIKDISQSDYGMYRLFIFNDVGQYNHTFTLASTVDTNDGTTAPSATTNASAVAAGAATGGVTFFVAVIIIIVFYKRRLLDLLQLLSRTWHCF